MKHTINGIDFDIKKLSVKEYGEATKIIAEMQEKLQPRTVDGQADVIARTMEFNKAMADVDAVSRLASVVLVDTDNKKRDQVFFDDCPQVEVMSAINDFFTSEGSSLVIGIVSSLFLQKPNEATTAK